MGDVTRTRWAAIGAAVAVVLGAGGIGLAKAAVGTGEKPVYIALDAPCRLVDTRPASTIGPKSTPIGAGEANTYEIQVTGANGNCTGTLSIPADAVAVATNVTAIAPVAPTTGRSFFTVYPGDAARPTTSNLNFLDGAPPVPNKVDVGLSAAGTIKIYNDEGTAHAAVDVFGYYIDHHHDDRYYTEAEANSRFASARQVSHAAIDGRNDNIDIPIAVSTVIASVTVDTPTSGYVVANSSVRLFASVVNSGAECAITQTNVVDAAATQTVTAPAGSSGMLAGTRGFQVNKGIPGVPDQLTINLACYGFIGDPRLEDPYLTAIFVADQDAFDPIAGP